MSMRLSFVGVVVLALGGCGGGGGGGDSGTGGGGGGGGSGTWSYETVNSGINVGFYPRLALDGTDQPHIVSTDLSANTYDYSHKFNGAWLNDTAVNNTHSSCSGVDGVLSDIAVNAADLPVISYELPDEAIFVTAYNGVIWPAGSAVSTDICPYPGSSADEAWGFVSGNALAVDPDSGTQWVAAHLYNSVTGGNHTLRAWDSASGNNVEVHLAASGDKTGLSPSIAIDSAGHPHVAFVYENSSGNDSVMHAEWSGSVWLVTTAADLGLTHSGGTHETAIVIDSTDRPHIFYYAGGYRHAVRTTGVWTDESIAPYTAGAGLAWVVAAIAGDDTLHVVFFSSPGSLNYVRKGAGVWSSRELIGNGGDDDYPDIAVASDGTVRVVFTDTTNDLLEYATRTP